MSSWGTVFLWGRTLWCRKGSQCCHLPPALAKPVGILRDESMAEEELDTGAEVTVGRNLQDTADNGRQEGRALRGGPGDPGRRVRVANRGEVVSPLLVRRGLGVRSRRWGVRVLDQALRSRGLSSEWCGPNSPLN